MFNKFLSRFLFLTTVFYSCSPEEVALLTRESLKGVKVIAHRGYWQVGGASQNSLEAITRAIEEDMDGVEVDVRMSLDGVLCLNHDDSYLGYKIHTTNSDLLDRLKLENGEALARFNDFVDIVRKHKNIELFIEIKSGNGAKYNKEVAQKVIQKLVEESLVSTTKILSFDLEILSIFKEVHPVLETMLLLNKITEFDLIDKYIVNSVGLDYKLLISQPEQLEIVRNAGFYINVWTVNNLKTLRKIAALNVDSITTDIPDRII